MSNNKVKVFKAQKELQEKSGRGSLSENKIKAAQQKIEDQKTAFSDYAKDYLKEISALIDKAKDNKNYSSQKLHNDLKAPLMALKSGSAVFGYDLVGRLSDIMFKFIDEIEELDNKAIEIISAQNLTFRSIIANKVSGDGGEIGENLEKELKYTCKQYLKRYNNK